MTEFWVIRLAIVMTLGILLWDLGRWLRGRQTISQATIALSKVYPLVPWLFGFAVGCLMGHLYL